MFRALAPPNVVCGNLVCTLKFLANQQLRGDRPVQVLLEGLQERSRSKIVHEPRRFITVDNHEAVKSRGLGEEPSLPRSSGPRRRGRVDASKR